LASARIKGFDVLGDQCLFVRCDGRQTKGREGKVGETF
jgi:hypothetical protein